MAEIEIEVKGGGEGCGGDCMCGGMEKPKPAGPTKDEMIAELKVLLNKTDRNGLAERQVQIDELMGKISEYGKEED